MANWILFGILWVQGYLYYVAFPKDPRLLKWIVFGLLLLETVQTMMWTQDTIEAFITTFTDPNVFNIVRTVWFSIPFLTGLIACISQGFYCYRIWALTRSKYAVTLISMLALGQFSAAIAVAVQTQRARLLTRLLSRNGSLASIGIWGACSFACDITIAVIMTYNLRKRSTAFKNTHRIIARLVRLTIEAGCVTGHTTSRHYSDPAVPTRASALL
ncbi:hypothetical protein HYPSUDRAFT_34768 [Hypholoma sublateritium FD-334 SS-4]|uniref:DUF6534 domain-containing protein n=1 Tax=Hypholoma sublateritium (strain FD-334 SS-4) TaxID=945553 RepID=A0A0D2Q7E8_HYPSF|nr:hypothetical protein HYPSUDRAFT_34768 [Hypholoma sublateritium FD-334 SS-4]